MKFIRSLYLATRLYWAIAIAILGFAVAFVLPWLLPVAKLVFAAVVVAIITDILLLYMPGDAFFATRTLPEKFSNGDENEVSVHMENNYRFPVGVKIIDEVPFQFQWRDLNVSTPVQAGERKVLRYTIKPVKRGEYHFGSLNAYVKGGVGLFERRFTFDDGKMVKVYPSFVQLRKYELMAIHHHLTDYGIKKIQRIGHTMEFEQVKNFVVGDDYRIMNWPASARKGELMANQYRDERSQNVYSVIDKGRLMKLPFDGLSLLDYAINASLVLSNIAIRKEDRAGILTFSDKTVSMLPADRRYSQMDKISEVLYHQKTHYLESNYELLHAKVRSKVNQRSLLILYTNFESLSSMQRNLRYLQSMARNHVLVVVFFVNTELQTLIDSEPKSVVEIYNQTIAEKFAYEKRQIVKELSLYGIHSILTPPTGLTVQVINKYLDT